MPESGFQCGQRLEAAGDLRGAIACYERATRAGDVDAQLALGYALTDVGDRQGADAAFLAAARNGSSLGMSNVGGRLIERGDLDGAQRWLERALELDHAYAGVKLGEVFHRRGDLTGAARAFGRADELGDDLAAYNVGILHRDVGEPELAERAWRRALDRGFANAALQLAGAASSRGDEEASERWLQLGGKVGYAQRRRDDWLTRTPREQMSREERRRADGEIGRWADDIHAREDAALNSDDLMARHVLLAEYAHLDAVTAAHAEAASRMATDARAAADANFVEDQVERGAVIHRLRLLRDGTRFDRLVVLPGNSVLGYAGVGDQVAFRLGWAEIEQIEVEGPDATHRRVTATRIAALGPFARAAKKREKKGFIVIVTRSTEHIFETGLTRFELRAELAAAIAALAPREVAAPRDDDDIVGKLAKLAEMHASGALSTDEFTVLKGRLIGQAA